MASAYLDCNERWITGTVDYLSIIVWDESDPDTDISAATATCMAWDANGAVVLISAAATVTGTTLLSITRLFDTTGIIGKVRAIFTVTLGSRVKKFQFAIEIDPLPGPQ